MWTGRQTLASIEETIAKLHKDEAQIDTALRGALQSGERLRGERDEALKELARIKLDEITGGRLVRNLDAAERRAVQILETARLRLASQAERKAAAVAEVEVAEKERHVAGEAVEVALAVVEQLRGEAQDRVKTMPAWQTLQAHFEAADAIASEAEKKAQLSEAELGAKQKPYDNDPLFIYLWKRNFGTGTYQAGNIARSLDRIVADFISYPDARANYAMLIEIPARLREHAKGKRAVADDVRAARGEVERRAMIAVGVEPKERVLAEARHRLASCEATLDGKRTQLAAIEQERAALLKDGGDGAYSEALSTIAAGDAHDDIAQLYTEARRTTTPADESIVRRIEQIDDKLSAAEQDLRKLKARADDLAERRTEVERVREKFRGAGYDHPNVTFGNDHDIGRILASVLEGVVRSGILWDIIRGGFGQRPSRSQGGFGSPGLPFPFPMPGGDEDGPRGGGWRIPESQGGWTPPADSGSGKDDDFTTGGSF
jgi:hypothetical protein